MKKFIKRRSKTKNINNNTKTYGGHTACSECMISYTMTEWNSYYSKAVNQTQILQE